MEKLPTNVKLFDNPYQNKWKFYHPSKGHTDCVIIELMEKQCEFCGKPIPKGRRTMCSILCIKRKNAMKRCKTSRFKEGLEDYYKTETGIAVKWEKWFCEEFEAQWANEEVMSAPYDAKWRGKNIDVKVSEYYVRKMKRGKKWNGGGIWNFKPNAFFKPEIDFFACICLKDGAPIKVLLIPSAIYNEREGLSVGIKSKFDFYNILQNESTSNGS